MNQGKTQKTAEENAPETFSGEQVQRIVCQVVKDAVGIVSRLVTNPEESMAAIMEMSELSLSAPGYFEKKFTENK